jgi:hypothetical protein
MKKQNGTFKVEWVESADGLRWSLWLGGHGPFAWIERRRNIRAGFAWMVGNGRASGAASTFERAQAAIGSALTTGRSRALKATATRK